MFEQLPDDIDNLDDMILCPVQVPTSEGPVLVNVYYNPADNNFYYKQER